MRREQPERQEKTRICIRIDTDLLRYFMKAAKDSAQSEHPAGYQTLINEALRDHLETQEALGEIVRDRRFIPPGSFIPN